MGIKAILGAIFIIIVFGLIGIYYFMPFSELEFTSNPLNYNFTIDGNTSNMQFYSNMRFEEKELSYKISDCNIKKQEEMRTAFEIMENLTVLSFYPVSDNEDITVTCDERAKFEGGMFIAGEGGPTQVVRAGLYNVISHGKILLLRTSDCERPNVAIHELLHVLGFVHSNNPNNVMYNYTSCKQTVGDDIPNLINELYSIPNYPDLVFENASARMNGRYLDLEMTVKNFGLEESKPTLIKINMKDDTLKEIELEGLGIGNGKIISVSNVFVGKLNIEDIELVIDYSEKELDKENNKIILEINK